MIEDNNFRILHICSMLHKLRLSEIKYNRTMYKVSYYRKIKAAILSKQPSMFLSTKNLKWKNNLKDLNKKIEQARLAGLKAQQEHLALKKKLNKPLNREVDNANYQLNYVNNHITGLVISKWRDPIKVLGEKEWVDRAAQYEATIAMNKLLSRD